MEEKKLSKEQIDLYIKEYLLPQFSRNYASYHFEITERGQRSTIIYLSFKDFKPLVIKGTKKKRKIEHMLKGTHHLQNHCIKVPEIINLDLSKKTYKKFGCYFVCEEKIEGWTSIKSPFTRGRPNKLIKIEFDNKYYTE